MTRRQLLYADVPELHERRNARRATVRRSPAAVLQFDGFSCYGTTVMRLSIAVTPGARHAARSASSISIHERTLPLSVTAPP